MKRRTYVATVAALTTWSGCISSAMSESPSNETHKTVSVSNVERRSPANPEKLDEEAKPKGLQLDVSVIDAEITPDATARVRLTYTNDGDDTIKLNINPERPKPQHSDADDPGLILLPDARDPTRASTDCWKSEQESFPILSVAYQHPIEPGGSETMEYDVWAAPQQEAECVQPGDYQFEPLFGSFVLNVKRANSETA